MNAPEHLFTFLTKQNMQRQNVPLETTSPSHLESGIVGRAHFSDKDKPEGKESKDASTRYFKLSFCFIGLQLSYIAWGVTQEQLMTNQYTFGKFKSSAFCVFANRFFALFVALAIVWYRRTFLNIPAKDVPYYSYAPSSISNSISSWAQYEALKFISFPSQVLSKSCKIIPVMLVRIISFLFQATNFL
jgi:adenosine 3'-phospho 5'-phosphosulfate transporter B2